MKLPTKVFLSKLASAFLIFLATNATAAVLYVDLNSTNATSPYADWSTAATNIQDAIDAAADGDQILVTNGVYRTGARSVGGNTTNLVYITKQVTVQSVNGPAVTVLQGYQQPGTNNSPNAIRCVYMSSGGAVLSGFTLTNGMTYNASGGGIYCTSTNEVVTNCIIAGNIASQSGGGSFSGTLINCILTGNSMTNFGYGGGAYLGTLVNCLLTGNRVGYVGGGAGYCTLINCTVVSNSASGPGSDTGGVAMGTAKNCIIYYNLPNNCNYGGIFTNCCSLPLLFGPNNITNAPGFVDLPGGNLRLQIGSPCIDAGANALAATANDLDANGRIFGSSVDMGAYENQFQGMVHYVSLSSTNPVAPYTNWPTAATNLQDAVGVAQTGEFVVANAGVYTNGGVVIYGSETNRVALTNAITLLGLYGAQATTIVGGTQMRCAYVGSNAALNGFTLTNGHARTSGDLTNEQSGGGAWCVTSGVISNCVVIRNTSSGGYGGGIYGGVVWNSFIFTNTAFHGGGVALASVFNSVIASNVGSATLNTGGGVYLSTISNCTVTANWSYHAGAGIYLSTAFSSLLSSNFSHQGNGGGAEQSILHDCIARGNYPSGTALGTNYNCILAGNSGGGNGGGMNGGIGYNCTLSNNMASISGGGAYQATLYNCLLIGNKVSNTFSFNGNGGGAYQGTLFNCLVVSNTATATGGGSYQGSLYNCTVVGNTATAAGGIYGGNSYNSIFYYNSATAGPNWSNAVGVVNSMTACCTTPFNGGITNAPIFMNPAVRDFHLQTNSACINSGINTYATNSTDFDGNARIVGGTVDIGAYEFQNPLSLISYAWLQQYGLPIDSSTDSADTDGDGFNNWQEWHIGTIPTNSASLLKMETAARDPSGVLVTWQSAGGIFYFIQRSTNLTAQPAFQTLATNIFGTSSYLDTSATNSGPYFYRVGVQ